MKKYSTTLLLIVTCSVLLVLSEIYVRWSSFHKSRQMGSQLPAGAVSREEVLSFGPSPELTPGEVVALQMYALRHSGDDDRGIATCFGFASLSNRQVTGPLARFTQMVKSPPYAVMLKNRSAEVVHVEVSDAQAMVIVRVTGQSQEPRAFLFALSKQLEAPYQDCWMTDAVMPIEQIPLPASRPPIEA